MAFADFLATRSTATLSVAPGVTTPLRFSDPRREHLATRQAAGVFDFSFMGCVEITGTGSLAFLNSLQTRALDGLQAGRIAYTLLLRSDGTVLNDATVWRLPDGRYWLFTGRRSDFAHIARYAETFNVAVRDVSQQHAVIAVQGSASRPIIEHCLGGQRIAALRYYGFRQIDFAGWDCWLARIGYSGETGYEVVTTDDAAPRLWQTLLAAGARAGLLECGFDAVDSLRIEAGHILFTRELAAPVSPFELGLTRMLDFYRPPFCGAQALQCLRWRSPRRRLVGLLPPMDSARDADIPARLEPGNAVMTSVCRSPLYDRCLGIGFAATEDAYPGATVRLRGNACARVARLPFYDPAKRLSRACR